MSRTAPAMPSAMKIKLMPDYECSPLWWDGEPGRFGDNIDPTDIGLDDSLKADLYAWAERYDATLDQDYPPDSCFATKEDLAKFVANGEALAARVRVALGPDWTVRYLPPQR
jgi:hypothetical protein